VKRRTIAPMWQRISIMSDNHKMECRECGVEFDMRSLQEVAIHEHDGAVPNTDIIGEQKDE